MDTTRVTADTATLVAAAIARSGLTSSAVASRAGIARTTLTRKLATGDFTISEASLIAQALGVGLTDLIGPTASQREDQPAA